MHAPDKYVGHRLTDLLSIGRDTVDIVCPACGVGPKSIPIQELIGVHGNVVLPHLLSLVTPSCPRRGKPESLGCDARYATPLTVEEEVAIKTGRMG